MSANIQRAVPLKGSKSSDEMEGGVSSARVSRRGIRTLVRWRFNAYGGCGNAEDEGSSKKCKGTRNGGAQNVDLLFIACACTPLPTTSRASLRAPNSLLAGRLRHFRTDLVVKLFGGSCTPLGVPSVLLLLPLGVVVSGEVPRPSPWDGGEDDGGVEGAEEEGEEGAAAVVTVPPLDWDGAGAGFCAGLDCDGAGAGAGAGAGEPDAGPAKMSFCAPVQFGVCVSFPYLLCMEMGRGGKWERKR